MKVQAILFSIVLLYELVSGFEHQKRMSDNQIIGKMKKKYLLRKSIKSKENDIGTFKKISIEIYSETLCPDCQRFMENSFKKAIITDNFLDYVDITMYFFGNAKEELDEKKELYTYKCQHGIKECEGNLISNCIVNTVASRKTAFDMIICLEQEIKKYFQPLTIQYDKILSKCNQKLNLELHSFHQILKCIKGKEGNSWQHLSAQRTLSQINLEFVPWIVVDGKHSKINQKAAELDLLQFTCAYFKKRYNKLHITLPFC